MQRGWWRGARGAAVLLAAMATPSAAADLQRLPPAALEVTRSVRPIYPDYAKPHDLPPTSCEADVVVAEDGAPQKIRFVDCPARFRPPSRKALKCGG